MKTNNRLSQPINYLGKQTAAVDSRNTNWDFQVEVYVRFTHNYYLCSLSESPTAPMNKVDKTRKEDGFFCDVKWMVST